MSGKETPRRSRTNIPTRTRRGVHFFGEPPCPVITILAVLALLVIGPGLIRDARFDLLPVDEMADQLKTVESILEDQDATSERRRAGAELLGEVREDMGQIDRGWSAALAVVSLYLLLVFAHAGITYHRHRRGYRILGEIWGSQPIEPPIGEGKKPYLLWGFDDDSDTPRVIRVRVSKVEQIPPVAEHAGLTEFIATSDALGHSLMTSARR